MSASNLVRFGGLAAMAGGALFVVAELLGLPTLNEETYSETVTRTSYAIQQLLFLLGVVFVLLGLVGLYVRQSEAAGALGLVGFLVAFAGTVLIAGFLWASAFIAPALADTAPHVLDGGPPPGILPSIIVFGLGWLLFGVATLRARVFPRASANWSTSEKPTPRTGASSRPSRAGSRGWKPRLLAQARRRKTPLRRPPRRRNGRSSARLVKALRRP